MNKKMEILALLFRCDAIINGYLTDKTFDATKITEENLKKIKADIDNDFRTIDKMADNNDFSSFKTKYEGLATLAEGWAKAPVNSADVAYNAIISAADLQAKIDEIEKLSISEKAKDTLVMIVTCQANIATLTANANVDTSIKAMLASVNNNINNDIKAVLNGLSDDELDKINDRYEGIDKMCESALAKCIPLKATVLDLMFKCKKEANDILDDDSVKLSNREKKQLTNILSEVGNDYMDAQSLNEGDKKLRDYYTKYSETAQFLKDFRNDRANRQQVKNVIPADKTPDATKDSRSNVLRYIIGLVGAGLIGALIAAVLMHCINTTDIDKDNDTISTDDPVSTQQIIDDALVAQNIDINDYTQLYDFACSIQAKLPSNLDISIDDIMYALRLANYDKLTENGYYSDRDEVCAATYYIGKLAPVVGVDALVQRDATDDITISDQLMTDIVMTSTDNELSLDLFAAAKVDGGYDIYRAAEVCLKGLYSSDEDLAFLYAKVMNELVCREAVNYSICSASPVSTHYTIAGMYTANQDRILELTSAKNLGPIYGTGPRIDGGHGAVCVEELASFMYIDVKGGTFIGNENNAIYSYVIDENITCNYGQNPGSR